MRCLYCGKELALLKRWTGGGDFCSDAHRQRYQEEYNQLALNRLLQAQQPAEAKPLSKPELKLKSHQSHQARLGEPAPAHTEIPVTQTAAMVDHPSVAGAAASAPVAVAEP